MFGLKSFVALSLAAFVAAAPATEIVERDLEARVTHQGRGTWFNVGLGNCGWQSEDSDYVIAMPLSLYQANNGGNCGQGVRIRNTKTGASVVAVMVDSCPTCGPDDIDLSPSLFSALSNGDLGLGVLDLKWNFLRRQ